MATGGDLDEGAVLQRQAKLRREADALIRRGLLVGNNVPTYEPVVSKIESIVRDPHIPSDVARDIARSEMWFACPEVLRHRDLTLDDLMSAFNPLCIPDDPERWVNFSFSDRMDEWLRAFRKHPDVTVEEWNVLIETSWDDVAVMARIVSLPEITADQAMRIVGHPSRVVRLRLARNPAIPEDTRVLAALTV